MTVNTMERESWYHLFDSILCAFVFFPSMVIYWRGIWDLWGYYVFPEDLEDEEEQDAVQEWTLVAIGACSIIGYFTAPAIDRAVKNSGVVTHSIITRAYMYVYAALFMCFWRGNWDLADCYLKEDTISSLIQFVITYGCLVLCRGARCAIFPPLLVLLDTRYNCLEPSTRFKTQPYSLVYALDCILSHFWILVLTIWSWRGLWNLQWSLIYPDDPDYGDWFCLVIGYLLILLVFALEEPLAKLSLKVEEKTGFYGKLAYQDVVFAVIFFIEGLLWRGAWQIVARYVFPQLPEGGWICFACGTFLLTVLQLFSYVSAHGIFIDGDETGREGIFPTKYLRQYLLTKTSQPSYVVSTVAVTATSQTAGSLSTANNTETYTKTAPERTETTAAEKSPKTERSTDKTSTPSLYDNVAFESTGNGLNKSSSPKLSRQKHNHND